MAITRNTETDGALVVTYPTASSGIAPNHEPTLSVRRWARDEWTRLVVTDRGPRGGEREIPISLNPDGTAALRAELRPTPHPILPTAYHRAIITERAEEAVSSLVRIEEAVALLHADTAHDERHAAALQPVLAEVCALLATALDHPKLPDAEPAAHV